MLRLKRAATLWMAICLAYALAIGLGYAADSKVTLTIAMQGSDAPEAWQHVFDKFEEQNPNVEVKPMYIANAEFLSKQYNTFCRAYAFCHFWRTRKNLFKIHTFGDT